MHTKLLVVLLLIVQCAFAAFLLRSVPQVNGQLRAAISELRNASQSNIARLDQNQARDVRQILEGLIDNQKFSTTVTLLFSFFSIALMGLMLAPFKFMRAAPASEPERSPIEL